MTPRRLGPARRSRAVLAVVLLAVGVAAGPAPTTATVPAAAAPFVVTPIAAHTVAEQAGAAALVDRAPALLILMDVSSSMNEADPGGGARIDGAKDAVTDFIDTLPSSSRVGLSTFPDDGSCGAGQSVIPIGPVDRTSMSARVRTLSANGETPTAVALERAGQQLVASGSGPYAIVLVSDGESNCGADPCAAAQQLTGLGIDVTINTVGFQISAEGRSELQCIAEATTGQYVDAGNGEELKDAITAYSVPELSLEISHPTTVAMQPGSSNEVVVEATARNTGAIAAPDVQATLTFDAEFSPGSAQPRRRLGNLEPGQAVSFGWAIRPTDAFASQTVKFTARAYTKGSATEPYPGEIRFVWDDDVTDLAPGIEEGGTLVVLGDSYSSGEGAPEGLAVDGSGGRPRPADVGRGEAGGLSPGGVYTSESDRRGASPNTCHRAPRHTWGAHIAADHDMRFILLACSGAKTADIWSGSTKHHTPSGALQLSQADQIRGLRRAPTALAMTMGGNDIGFSSLALRCLLISSCYVGAGFEAGPLAALPRKLVTAYQSAMSAARERAGRMVPMYVMPYPAAFPGILSSCRREVSLALSVDERVYLNGVVATLNGVIERQVEALQRGGWPISFVKGAERAAQPDHTMCARDPWINGVSLSTEAAPTLDPIGLAAHSFHPNYEGYAAMANSFEAWLSTAPETSWPSSRVDTVRALPSTPTRTVAIDGGGTSATLGESVWVTADGFEPGSFVTIDLASNPENVGVEVADEDGAVKVPVWVRSSFPIGDHHLVVEGTGADGEPLRMERALAIRRPIPIWWWVSFGVAVVAAIAATGCWSALLLRRRAVVSASSLDRASVSPSG